MKGQATYSEKMRQANREAKSTVVGLIVVVVAWIALGFGVATADIEVFHTPLWVITGTVGTWIVAIVVAVVLSKRVIVDTDLDDAPSAPSAQDVQGTPGEPPIASPVLSSQPACESTHNRQPESPGQGGRFA